jgi:hypothetical protein
VEQLGGDRDVGELRLQAWLAVVQGLDLGELLGVIEDQIADTPQDLAALGRRQRTPRPAVERDARGRDRQVDVFRAALGHRGQSLAGRGIGRVERPAGKRPAALTADEQRSGRGQEVGHPLVLTCLGHVIFFHDREQRLAG